jgi:putative membrane protein
MGIDEVFGVMLASLKGSLRRGRFTFVSYMTALLLLIVGVIMGLTSILVHYTSTGILQFILMFSYGAVGWITAAGIIAAIGKIIDVYMNERELLGRVIVLPFFLFALGAIIYGISVYILSISNVPMFEVEPSSGIQYIIISTVGGIACALIGMYIQAITSKWVGENNIL